MASSVSQEERLRRGRLVINGDDWGRDRETTDRTLDCISCGAVTAVSAMVFMEDSERAAEIARIQNIDTGLHMNFTSPFTAETCPPNIVRHQQRIARCLLRYRFAQVLFHPTLMGSFERVVAAQIAEFRRLYGAAPERFDGHHHMHLCANVLLGGLLPRGTVARRNFSFEKGEKSIVNRYYRRAVDRLLVRHHRLTDFFFSLEPLEPTRLERIGSLAGDFEVELETHCTNPEEYRFLMDSGFFQWLRDCQIKLWRRTATAGVQA